MAASKSAKERPLDQLTMAMAIAISVSSVLPLPQVPAGITPPWVAAHDRSPETTNSRPTMTITIQAGASPMLIRAISVAATSSLSAMRSHKLPNCETTRQRRARYPSR